MRNVRREDLDDDNAEEADVETESEVMRVGRLNVMQRMGKGDRLYELNERKKKKSRMIINENSGIGVTYTGKERRKN